jgi:MFS family permease
VSQASLTTATAPAVALPGPGLRGSPRLALLAAALGVSMVALDSTIVSVANPAIQSQLHASLADLQWVSNGYLLTLAVTLIAIGQIADRVGHRRVFLTGVAGFALTSAAIGLSGSISLVITLRVAQGGFGAMLQPSALALLRDTFPPRRLNTAIGAWGAAIGVSTAAGPIVGGLLVQHAGWEACFYVNIPVALIALTMGLLVLRETPTAAARFFDLPGMALLSAALFLLIWPLIQGAASGWGSAATIGFFAAAACAGGLFTVRETRAREPLRLLRSASLSAGTALVVMLMFPLVGGALLATVALLGLSRLGATSGLGGTAGWFALLGLGLSPVVVGATDVIVGRAPAELTGVAAGLQATAMQVGGTLGTAVLGAVMSARVAALLPADWIAAHLPALTAARLARAGRAVTVGGAPVGHGTPAPVARAIVGVSHAAFLGGLHAVFLVARRSPSPAPWPACSPSGELQGAPAAARHSCFVNEY